MHTSDESLYLSTLIFPGKARAVIHRAAHSELVCVCVFSEKKDWFWRRGKDREREKKTWWRTKLAQHSQPPPTSYNLIMLWGDHHAAETGITTSALRHSIWSLYEFINNIVTWWQLLWDKLFRTTHISIRICSARHFIASLDFFYCSSRCSSGYHQRDLCKLITAKESPELNKHIQAGNGPRLLL